MVQSFRKVLKRNADDTPEKARYHHTPLLTDHPYLGTFPKSTKVPFSPHLTSNLAYITTHRPVTHSIIPTNLNTH